MRSAIQCDIVAESLSPAGALRAALVVATIDQTRRRVSPTPTSNSDRLPSTIELRYLHRIVGEHRRLGARYALALEAPDRWTRSGRMVLSGVVV